VSQGWDSQTLDEMSETEFLAVLDAQQQLEETRAEARARMMEE